MMLRRKRTSAFSLTELLVTVVLVGITTGAIYSYIGKQRKISTSQRMRADIESLEQISFFIMARDIRRAGSNPKGGLQYSVGASIPLLQAKFDKIEILADLSGDGDSSDTDEDITYEFIDNPLAQDGIKDQIRRQAGNLLVIENVRSFDLSYQIANGAWYCKAALCPPAPATTYPDVEPPNTELIRKVNMRLIAGTGHVNPSTGVEDTKEIAMNILLRNYH